MQRSATNLAEVLDRAVMTASAACAVRRATLRLILLALPALALARLDSEWVDLDHGYGVCLRKGAGSMYSLQVSGAMMIAGSRSVNSSSRRGLCNMPRPGGVQERVNPNRRSLRSLVADSDEVSIVVQNH